MRRTKIVIDSNLIIASYWNGTSASRRLIDLCLDEKFRTYHTIKIRKEAFLILDKINARRSYKARIAELFRRGKRVVPRRKIEIVKKDPEDNKYLECALRAKAGFIVTNDQHLLAHDEFKGLRILPPGQFLRDCGLKKQRLPFLNRLGWPKKIRKESGL